MMSSLAFVEKSKQSTVTSIAEVEEENRTDDSDSEGGIRVPVYTFTDNGDGTLKWAPANGVLAPIFTFDASSTQIKLTAINGQAVEVLHYSLKSDNTAFSILVSFTQAGSGQTLVAYTWGSTEEINSPAYTSGDYQYLNGSEKVSWSSVPDVKLCGSYSDAVQSSIQASVLAWGDDPSATSARTMIPYSVETNYPPFSDLNSHCIYVVSSFDQSDSPVAKTLGVTTPHVNLASRKIVDSDVFLFADIMGDELSDGVASSTTMHEMGHFFGLGHDFRIDSSGEALHPTIMGYSQGTDTITEWDFESIRELYVDSLQITL